jgi:hypothetical protein
MPLYNNTPQEAPLGVLVIKLYVPEGEGWELLARGALLALLDVQYWTNQETDGLTPEETVEYFTEPILNTVSLWEPC